MGESPTVIARILGVCRTSLYRGKKMAQADPKRKQPTTITLDPLSFIAGSRCFH